MSGARRIQHSWHSTPADNFFSSLSTRRRSPRRKFEARIAERADVFHGWFSSPLLIPLAFVDRRTRGIGQVNEQASERTHLVRAARGSRMGNSANIKCFTGAPNQRRAVDDDAKACRNEILHYSTLSFPFLSLYLFHSRFWPSQLVLYHKRATEPTANYNHPP